MALRSPRAGNRTLERRFTLAADTTFVQFYPTLLPIAEEKQTLSASYLKEGAAAVK
jgi:aspartate oxidase